MNNNITYEVKLLFEYGSCSVWIRSKKWAHAVSLSDGYVTVQRYDEIKISQLTKTNAHIMRLFLSSLI